jgi:hypothetical protein
MVLSIALLALAALQAPRLVRIVSGEDSSTRARASYLEAGWNGFLVRPLLGWGPGSAAWTVSSFRVPVPGVNPWGEAVGDLHSLPVHLGYELGATGLLLASAVFVLFVLRRLRERREIRDPLPRLCALLGLLGAAVASLANASVAVSALPLAVAVVAGVALVGGGESSKLGSALPVRVYALLAALALLPLELARWHYDRAATGSPDRARAEVARAVELDPLFPLYRMRLALLQGSASEARRAAENGGAVSVLWTVAGVLGSSARLPWTGEALERACVLDPLDPFPPFYRMLLRQPEERAVIHGAHALMAEPRLAAAVFWEVHGNLLSGSLEAVRCWPGVDPGWKEGLIASSLHSTEGRGDGPTGWLALEIDTVPALSLSLPVFRRRPWPMQWPLVRVRQDLVDDLALPPATALPGTSVFAFTAEVCHVPG